VLCCAACCRYSSLLTVCTLYVQYCTVDARIGRARRVSTASIESSRVRQSVAAIIVISGHGNQARLIHRQGKTERTQNYAAMSKIDWAGIREKLPMEKTPEQKAKRKEMFDDFDPNGNGILSLAEVDLGLKKIGLYKIFDCKKVIMRAFQAAKGVDSKDKANDDFVEFSEFRLLLVYLRHYFELWEMFDGIDTGDDHRVDLDEFKVAIPKIEAWGFKVEDPEAEFAKIDANGGGQILFDEFSHWAIKKGLDLEDDDD
jgi:Ca2+-binding EF-hand superfamily protein